MRASLHAPLAVLAALAAAGCFSVQPPNGRYHCEELTDCLDGFTCYEGYCCQKERFTQLCIDHPCLVSGADADRDGFPVCANDCDDEDATAYPGAPELCDGKDNDCNGTIDDGATIARFLDRDEDGHGSNKPEDLVYVCSDAPNLSKINDDCDDTNPSRFAGATEVCDLVDNDCDDAVDEGVTTTWYRDDDGDGYGQTDQTVAACERPTGYAAQSGDCQDQSALIRPGRDELCNDFDDNCDGQTDEGVKQTFFPDGDKDGYGGPGMGIPACSAPTGYAANQTDCNDADALIHPGVAERCNDADDDCDGQTDEGVRTTWYRDEDGDTWGRSTGSVQACMAPGGFVDRAGDCKDTDMFVNPARPEGCNGFDDDCDGLIDEALTQTFFRDQDADGYGTPAQTTVGCPSSPPSGYVGNALDCNDASNLAWPGRPEACDGLDNDCDGAKDNLELCGPKVDQAEVAGAWGGGINQLTGGGIISTGCIAGTLNSVAITPSANTVNKTTGAAAIQASITSNKDFFLYYPLQRNAAWDLRKQQLRFDVGGSATAWATGYAQPAVFFCSANGGWARYLPPTNMLSSNFTSVVVTIPNSTSSGGPWLISSGFAWQAVDWVEVHANPNNSPASSLLVDDLRFATP